MKKNSNKKQTLTLKFCFFYFAYTCLFALMVWAVFGHFFKNNVSLINTADAFRQHIKALAYYAKWMRGIIYHLFTDHSLDIQTFSFGMGYGTDIYPTLQYYAIGDILNIPAALVPNEYIYIYFQAAMLLRPYIAGITFSALVFYLRPKASKVAVMAGMFTYSLCTFYMFLGIWHPYFANPMIYMPLVILGAEKIFREEKSSFFAFAIFLAGTNNFFFFYMIVLLTVVYCIVRAAFSYGKDFASWGKTIGKFAIAGVIGTVMSMVILLPVIFAFPANPRTNTGITFSLLYSKEYYDQLIRNFYSFVYHGLYDTQIGFHGIILLALFMLIIKALITKNNANKKNNLQLFVIGLILTAFVSIPFCGYALTGFAYVINRWTFAFALFAAFMLVDMWEDLFNLKRAEIIALVVLAAVFILVCKLTGNLGSDFENSRAELILMGIGGVICIITSLFNADKRAIKTIGQSLILALCLVGIVLNGYYAYAPEKGNMIGEYYADIDTEQMHILLESTEVQAVEEAAESEGVDKNSFYRYSGRDLVWNASLIDGISSTQFYWSLANGVVSDYFKEMGNNDQQNFAYFALDDRAILNTLAGVKYYSLRFNTEEEQRFVPYGFTHLYDKYNFAVFKNTTPLSLGYTYYNVIPKSLYDGMSQVERQEALLYGIVLDEDDASYPEAEVMISSYEVPCEITGEGDVVVEDGKWTAKGGSSVHIKFSGAANCETYLRLDDFYVESDNDYPLMDVVCYTQGQEFTKKQIWYKTEENQFYSDWHDYAVNMGYGGVAMDEIVISFYRDGVYTFDNLGVYCQPLEGFANQVQVLSEDMLENIELNKNPISYATNTVTGDITLKDRGVVCLTIPYSKGWTAYVDGVKTDIYKANTMWMALKLDEGSHQITLKYHTPGLTLGLILTILGIIAFIILIRVEEKKNAGK
ncbi:YfhO family protein [Butyrivibrio proteoclasticus]|uniref:YfhO family protein n=1 Tax=Butyrivibrio proteoclasticus TaxID=43305 RepID=UPI00047BCFB6|nr:YfhO family protein [Butyrivibrio proteoclasticus]